MATHVYSLVMSYVNGGQFSQNVLHYQFDDAGFTNTSDAASSLCNAFNAANTTPLKTILPTTTQITSYKGRNITAGGGFEGILLIGATFGLRAGNLSTSGVSPVLVVFPSANAKPRGRIFLPGVTDTDLVNGEFTTSFKNAVNAQKHFVSDTLTLTGGGGPVATPVVVSRKTVPVTPYVVEYVRLSPMPGTQRRRQRPA